MRLKLSNYRMILSLVVLSIAAITSSVMFRVSASVPATPQVRRLETIMLEPAGCKLHWKVSRGEVHDGKFVSKGAAEEYSIDFHTAAMTHNGVTYKFSEQEASSVHQVMLALLKYAAESVEWFEEQDKPSLRAAK